VKPEHLLSMPYLLSEVPDPCTEVYWPEWSSRGMRPVRCSRHAKATIVSPPVFRVREERRVCGIHAASHRRAGWQVDAD
jgi:hypothetical protein